MTSTGIRPNDDEARHRIEPDREGPWFEVGDRITFGGWENSQYHRAGLNVFATVVETKLIAGSKPGRQQFRAEGADWCGGGSMWNHSDDYVLAPDSTRTTEDEGEPPRAAGLLVELFDGGPDITGTALSNVGPGRLTRDQAISALIQALSCLQRDHTWAG